ncbi:MAG: DUF3105 domain-containing protein [Candidatus Limnocylindria bacterium]
MGVTTPRRQRREREKRDKHRRHRQMPHGRRRAPGWLMPAAVVGALVLGIFALRAAGVFDPPPRTADINLVPEPAQPLGTRLPDEGNAHVPTGQRATYNTIPPASGPHWAQPAAPAPWGVKDGKLPDEVTVHNLEHGGVVISYNGLAASEVDLLRSLVRNFLNTQFRKIILQPYPELTDAKIAVTAWRWQLKLQSVDEVQIAQFVRARHSSPEAPEPNAR